MTDYARGYREKHGLDVDFELPSFMGGASALDGEHRDPNGDRGRRSSWVPVELESVLAGDYLDPPPIMLTQTDGVAMFYAAKLNSLYSEPEGCKGWLALSACVEQLDDGRDVLYVDFEDSAAGIIARLRDLGVPDDTIRERFHYIRPSEPLDARTRKDLDGALDRHRPALVVVDGVTEALGLQGLDLRDNSEVARFLELVRPLTRHGAAVVLIDHVAKDRDNRGRFAIGAQHKLAGIDGAAYVLEVVRPFGRERDGLVMITVAKDRPGHVRQHTGPRSRIAEAHLHSDPDGGVGIELRPPEGDDDANDGTFRPTVLMEKLSRALETQPQGLGIRALRGAVKGANDAKALALELLAGEGYVTVTPGARNAQIHRSVRPFRRTHS
jgi:AAA domain